MKIAIATDHRGVQIKKEIIDVLATKYDFIDLSKENHDTDDYPDFAIKVAECVANQNADFGILLCGTGIGMSIAANKVKGIRCALVHNEEEAMLARAHNHANILALGVYNSIDDIIKFIEVYLNTNLLSDEKYIRRVKKIDAYENGETYEC